MADQEQALVRSSGDVTYNAMGEVTERRAVDAGASGQVAYAEASIQARYVMALKQPRNEDNFRAELMKRVGDPEFASICEYARPVGKEKNAQGKWVEKIAKGPTIHLLRTALRLFKNNSSEPTVITETPGLRVVAMTLSDFETNFHVVRTFTIEKIVEKRGVQDRETGEWGPPPGRDVLAERLNTYGDKVYICRMTADELRKEELRQTALAKRAAAEEFLPRHIIRAVLAKAVKIAAEADAKDPQGAKNKLIDAFAEINIMAVDIEHYLGHTLDRLSSDELAMLRGTWTRVTNDEATWEECLAERNPTGSTEDADKVRHEKLAALRAGTPEKPEPKSAEQAATGTVVAPVDAPTGESRYITADQAQEFAQVIHQNNLDDEQITKLVKAGGAERYDQMQPKLFETVLKMAKATKGKGVRK